jgi:hypothetical protein
VVLVAVPKFSLLGAASAAACPILPIYAALASEEELALVDSVLAEVARPSRN